ncbi:hypothetical protein NL533_32405, partial [Klebsiella pneumoniae]|nr:hypothetical protein [Klebsiella pneumoniae]
TDLVRLDLAVANASQADRSVLDSQTGGAPGEGWSSFFKAVASDLGIRPRSDWQDPEWNTLIDPDGA